MGITPKLDDLGNRLDRIETKLDNHLERVTGAERDIEWIRGHLRISTVVVLGVCGALGAMLLRYMFPGV